MSATGLEALPLPTVRTATIPMVQLGCGTSPRPVPGAINCDLYPGPTVDVVFDLMERWPFETGSVLQVYASHVLEHLPDIFRFFREAHRVLCDSGQVVLRMPYGLNRAAWCDPTHLRPYFPESFTFLQPGYAACIGNPQHESWDAPFLVDEIGLTVARRWRRWMSWYWLRKRLCPHMMSIPDAFDELWMQGRALKSPETLARARVMQPVANLVPVRFLMYQHDWEYKPPGTFGMMDLSYPRVVPWYGRYGI